ncbi:MAG: cytochrome b [Candidatus Aminicenantes bacterium]
MKNLSQRLFSYFNQRFQLSELARLTEKKTVPEHKHSFWYYFGGICLFLFALQVITGLLLLLYYIPSVDHAYESIHFIMSQVEFGWLIRSVHSWSANILMGAIFVHMFSTFFLKAYRPPRELTWISGFFLLLVFLAFGFSGYLLPWNKLSFFATRVGTDIVGSLPWIGEGIKTFILGGSSVSQSTLTRFFWLHVAVLPLLAVVIVAVHVILVQILGMSRPIGVREAGEVPFFPHFLLKDSLGWILILALIGILCVFFPWEIGQKADPFAPTPLDIQPEWYFLFMFTTLKLVPSHVFFMEGEILAIFGFMAGGLVWMLVPYLDRRAAREKRSPFFPWLGLVVLVYMILLTVLSFVHPRM